MSTLVRNRPLRLAGFAVGAVALAGSAVYVTASAAGYNLGFNAPSQSSSQAQAAVADRSGSASAACTDFLSHFASDLGTTQSKVDAAFQQALAQTLADEVKSGKITQARADAIKKRLAGKEPCSLAGGLQNRQAARYMQELLAASASALGISPQQLRADLMNGMTLSQIAAAQHPPVTEDQFRSKLIANLKPLLDKAVSEGKLTSAQEQQIVQRLQTGPIPLWDKPLRRGAASPSPSPSPSA